jgi:AcrR family transcriptional regulator
MATTEAARGPAFEDLTARARIRDAALAQFAERGFERTTIRGIAAAAGVSSGLVRHHFGSKQELRAAADAHVVQVIQRISKEITADGGTANLTSAVTSREEIRPFQRYLMRGLLDGSPTFALIFDQLVESTEQWLLATEDTRSDAPYVDLRARAAVIVTAKLSIPILHEQLTRVLGVDTTVPPGENRVALAMLDLFTHPLVDAETGDTLRDALGPTE